MQIHYSCLVSDHYIFFELLIKIMRIVEALENRGFRVPLMKEEADLYERLVAIIKQVSSFTCLLVLHLVDYGF